MAKTRRVFLDVLLTVMLGASALATAAPAQGFSCGTVPVGQANPSAEPEPMQPVWCLGNMAAEPTTRQIDPWGGWQDAFQTNVQVGQLDNGDMGYRVFDALSNGNPIKTRHFVNNNHWMVDISHDNGGAALSPSQAFHFQNGRLVIEADVAAGIPGYSGPDRGDIVWPEIDWSTAPAPTGRLTDGLYLYGHFGGQWASGCRLNAGHRALTCALDADHDIQTTRNDTPPCYPSPPVRLFELSAFQACGSAHSGFAADFGAPQNAWRECQPNQMDMYCRDRFRLEWSQTGFVAYVNGIKYAEDSGWPGYAQIPASIVAGQVPVYAYFGEWGDFSDANVYRFHWGRVAVNPHDQNGNLLRPSTAPSYCPGQAQNTCAMAMQAPMPDSSAAATMPAMPSAAPSSHSAPKAGSMPGMDARALHLQTHVFLTSALNAGQQPLFWLVLGLMLAGGAAAGLVTWLWLGGSRHPSG